MGDAVRGRDLVAPFGGERLLGARSASSGSLSTINDCRRGSTVRGVEGGGGRLRRTENSYRCGIGSAQASFESCQT